jgi:calcium-dependent protein kinase
MMTYDYKDRPTAREMLEHEWVREDGVATDNELQPEVLQRMRSFAAMNRLKKQALLVMNGFHASAYIHAP